MISSFVLLTVTYGSSSNGFQSGVSTIFSPVQDVADRALKPARDLVVLTRAEPAVAPGDEVMITGLAVDGDTLWATELRAAGGAAAFPGL